MSLAFLDIFRKSFRNKGGAQKSVFLEISIKIKCFTRSCERNAHFFCMPDLLFGLASSSRWDEAAVWRAADMSSLADLVQTALMLNSNKRAVGCMVPAPLGLILFKLCMVGAAVGGGDCDSLDIGREFETFEFRSK